jgi:hypothetical protein
MRLRILPIVAWASLIGLFLPQEAPAAITPALHMAASGPFSQVETVYYYRGRHYPYRYRGQYFQHRYHRHGRWHYY